MTVLDIMQTWNVIEWQYQIEVEGTKSDQMDGLELEKKLSKKLKKDKDQK
jgi:hypothetical protein